MGIDPPDKIHNMPPFPNIKSAPGRTTAANGIDFSDVLEKSIHATRVRPVVRQQAPGRPADLRCALHDPAQVNALNHAVRMLDAMERYQNLLADFKVNLRAMEPAVAEMKKETGLLQAAMEKLPAPNALKDLLGETLLIATKEIARFDSGDYVGQ